MQYVKTAVFANIDNLLTYKTIRGVEPGCRVVVPLGTKLVTGVVAEKTTDPGIDPLKIKPIRKLVDKEPVLNKNLMKTGEWISSYYLSSPGVVYSAMLAALFKVKSKKTIKLVELNPAGLSPIQQKTVDFLMKRRGKKANIRDIEKAVNNCSKAVKELEEKGVVVSEGSAREKTARYGVFQPETGRQLSEERLTLSAEQERAVNRVKETISAGVNRVFLLFGITGSGKTEVYIRAAKHAVSMGKKAVILVPEIFLTPQITERFKKTFKDRTAIYHSGLSENERNHEWRRMKNGDVDVVVGTRSAIFAPFENTGLFVVDEEFDASYRQENDPRYNARDTALYRATLDNAAVILGTATPCAETYKKAMDGTYELLELPHRVNERPLPGIKIIDLKYDLNKSRGLLFSNELAGEMSGALEAGGQVILFVNRRGFSSYVFCRECGHVEKCGECDIPLVYHKKGNSMKCHYCDSIKKPAVFCPQCKKPLSYKGLGTQRVEDVTAKFFPGKKIERIDLDSMKGKKEYFDIYMKIINREIDILIGTQMVAKGFDFPGVTFVGVVSIDAVLNLPDFRSEERVFQLLTQVAGRTGRGGQPGKVVIQTFNPDNSAIKNMSKYDIKGFYAEQMKIRKELNYPPFSSLLQVVIQDADLKKCEKTAQRAADEIKKAINAGGFRNIRILGPAPSPLVKIRNKYRYSIILKGNSAAELNTVGKHVKKKSKGGGVAVIVDPLSLL